MRTRILIPHVRLFGNCVTQLVTRSEPWLGENWQREEERKHGVLLEDLLWLSPATFSDEIG